MSSLLQNDWFLNAIPIVILAAFVFAILQGRRQPLWAEAYRRLGRNRLAVASMVVLFLYFGIALLDSIGFKDATTHDRKTVVDRIFQRPRERTYSAPGGTITAGERNPHPLVAPGSHVLGTDGVGEDVLYRTIKGCRTAIIVGGLTTLIALPLAVALGLIAGYFGKITDDVVQYVYTVMATVPDVLLLIAMILVLGRGLIQLCIALGVTSWVTLCRLVRGETLKHRDREYVRAAKALGASPLRIMVKHILPNLLPLIIISTTLGFSGLVLAEAVLSYLGVGVGPEVGSWGNMIDGARDELSRNPVIWWTLTAATVALFGLVLALNILGDALRDAIDPKLRS